MSCMPSQSLNFRQSDLLDKWTFVHLNFWTTELLGNWTSGQLNWNSVVKSSVFRSSVVKSSVVQEFSCQKFRCRKFNCQKFTCQKFSFWLPTTARAKYWTFDNWTSDNWTFDNWTPGKLNFWQLFSWKTELLYICISVQLSRSSVFKKFKVQKFSCPQPTT